MFNKILIIFGFIVLINQLLVLAFNDFFATPIIFYIEISELFFIISFTLFLIRKKKIFITGFYFLILCLPGLITKSIIQTKINSLIMLIAGFYIFWDYIKNLIEIDHKPIIKIFEYIYPKKWIYKYKLADIEYQKKNHEKAIKYIHEALKLGASKHLYQRSYGYILFSMEKYDEAKSYLIKAYKNNPDDILILCYIGYSYNYLGDFNQAIIEFTKYLDKDINNLDILHERAAAYQNIGEINKAIEDYSLILEYDPERSDILYNRGLLFDEINEKEKALIDWGNSIKLKNPDPKSYIVLGNHEYINGSKDKAKELYLKGLYLDESLKNYVPLEYLNNY